MRAKDRTEVVRRKLAQAYLKHGSIWSESVNRQILGRICEDVGYAVVGYGDTYPLEYIDPSEINQTDLGAMVGRVGTPVATGMCFARFATIVLLITSVVVYHGIIIETWNLLCVQHCIAHIGEENMLIKCRKINAFAKIPMRMSEQAAGYDLVAVQAAYINPSCIARVAIGLELEIPNGYEGQIRSRSGLANQGICVANAPGTIDADYRGEVSVLLINHSPTAYVVNYGDRIAQLVIARVESPMFQEEIELSSTVRGMRGLGSTGV